MAKSPDKSIDDTGERMVPAYHKGHIVYAEHIVRYEAAMQLVKGKAVLDIASGSGYGTSLLSQAAKKVYGVDLDADAIKYAKKNYGSDKIEFIQGDGNSIPLNDDSVDIVVSFETIEHIEDYPTFMKEVKRVLRNDGLFILSTPNDVEFPETNHFHIHEFEKEELETLVRKYFKYHKSYFQGTWLYNGLFTEKELNGEWEAPIQTMQTAPITPKQAIYFYMLCANRKVTESVSSVSAIGEHYSERRRQEYETSVRKHVDDQAAIIKHLENSVKEKENQLHSIENSRAWRMVRRMQGIRAKARRRL